MDALLVDLSLKASLVCGRQFSVQHDTCWVIRSNYCPLSMTLQIPSVQASAKLKFLANSSTSTSKRNNDLSTFEAFTQIKTGRKRDISILNKYTKIFKWINIFSFEFQPPAILIIAHDQQWLYVQSSKVLLYFFPKGKYIVYWDTQFPLRRRRIAFFIAFSYHSVHLNATVGKLGGLSS